ncbi:interferon-induced, double-stranded RNA-activated protein kinase [Ahaetulla prasina]|uniref:interferon-induced, double-stranded RNA-activated protein kinase n=1 Tax=Ahaetulla prasina TaxID=499056 RepID=UPI002647F00D|nr:interferon-induced, double-stranded RNA-activated protein kinase [Ahaetulla prasina]XP_058020447.1 interferon-induced, double-stranded RNA-activated protein kinase [Ahaetulla prasina]
MADNHIDPRACMQKLNEYCQKNLFKLEYKDIAITGPSHDRVFTIAVAIGKDQYESAIGKTKKAAKALAAVLAWNTIQEQKKGELDSCEQDKESTLSPLSLSVSESTSSNSINYVSLLNEYALKNKVHVQYNLISKTGLEHKPVFSYECRIGDMVFDVGKGNKVQVAKLEAAKLAYEKLTSSSTFRAEERANSISDSSDTTFSSSQGLSSEASGSNTDLDSEQKKTFDTFTNGIQLNETSSSQNPVSPPSQSMKPKRKETPLAARFSNRCTRTSKFTKNDRFLEDFDDIEEIGLGGFGNVFKAKNTIDGRLCAIKRILLSGKKEKGEKEKREVKALAKLDHAHIVRYYACWSGQDIFQFPDISGVSSEQYDCLFIHMELCEKGNLSDWLDKKMGNSCKDVSIILFQQIVEGVDYIHSMDLIHRDLKPLNVFFHGENHIKIGDFGLVTGVDDGQRTTNTGTMNYMAPEQEGSDYGKKVDIFPLGLILYEMLSPFSTHNEKYKEWPNIKEGKFPKTFTNKFTEETSLIKKLLSKEPTQRPSAADILKILKGQHHNPHTC